MIKRIVLSLAVAFSMLFPMQADAQEVQICHAGKSQMWCIDDSSINVSGKGDAAEFTMIQYYGGDSESGRYIIWMDTTNGKWFWQRSTDPDHLYFDISYSNWSGYFKDWLTSHGYL